MNNEYQYQSGQPCHTESYLWTPVHEIIRKHLEQTTKDQLRLMDVGCGNGAFLDSLRSKHTKLELVGVEPSESGVANANHSYPGLEVKLGSGYDKLSSIYGVFDVVTSLEVVEHVYSPRVFAKTLFDLLAPNGIAILTTPYHGYLKNLTLALAGKLDQHFTALWDHGHIKFWSVRTLTELLKETGFRRVEFNFAGRVPALAKSMIAVAGK